MQALEARALLFKRELKMINVDQSIPDVPELDGQLAVLEMKGTDTSKCEKLATDSDGKLDETAMMAEMIVRALVMRDTKERVCQDNDGGMVAQWGLQVLKPLSELVGKASGLDSNALPSAKTFLPPTTESTLSSTSVNSSEVDQTLTASAAS